MPTGSGIDAQIGAKKETTYGTRVVPNQFFLFNSENVNLDKNYTTSNAIGAGNFVQYATLRVPTTQDPTGPLNLEVMNQGHGFWFDLLHNNTVTPVQQGASTAYLQTHNIGTTPVTKSASLQIGRPDTGLTVDPFDYTGVMLTGFQYTIAANGLLEAQYTWNGQKEDTTQSLAAKSIQTGLAPYNFAQCALKIGGVTVADIYSATITGTIPMKVDRFPLNTTGLKNKPIPNGLWSITGTLSGEFSSLTDYNRFLNNTAATVILECIGSTFTGSLTNTYLCRFTLDTVVFDSSTPNVSGPDVVMQDRPIQALYGGTNPPLKIEYQEQVSTAL